MRKEIALYCESDVDILRRAMMKFRDIFIKETGVDPFHRPSTIASACNRVYRENYLEEDLIGLIPPGGYRRREKQSVTALK